MGTFLVCWTPFFLINIWRSWDPTALSKHFCQVNSQLCNFSTIIAFRPWPGWVTPIRPPTQWSTVYSTETFDVHSRKLLLDCSAVVNNERIHMGVFSRNHSEFKLSYYTFSCIKGKVFNGFDRRRSYTRSSETHENNNLHAGPELITTRLVMQNNNESSVIIEE